MIRIAGVMSLVFSLAIMAVSCRVGAKYDSCVASCNNKAQAVYLACTDTVDICSLMADFYKSSCKKACE